MTVSAPVAGLPAGEWAVRAADDLAGADLEGLIELASDAAGLAAGLVGADALEANLRVWEHSAPRLESIRAGALAAGGLDWVSTAAEAFAASLSGRAEQIAELAAAADEVVVAYRAHVDAVRAALTVLRALAADIAEGESWRPPTV